MNTAEALRLGNQVRQARAKLRREVRSGTATVADVLLEVPDCAQRMTMGELLRCVKGLGPFRIEGICEQARVSSVALLGDVTLRQRRIVTGLVQRWER